MIFRWEDPTVFLHSFDRSFHSKRSCASFFIRSFISSFIRSFIHSKRSCASFFIHPSHHPFILKDDPPAPLSSSIRLIVLSFQRIPLCLFLHTFVHSKRSCASFVIHSFIPSIFHSKGSSASFFIHSVINSFIPKDPVPPLSSFIPSFLPSFHPSVF